MIRFSCSDYTFPLLSRRQSLQLIWLLGFDFVDLGLFARSPELSPQSLASDSAAFTRDLKQDLTDTGLSVSDLFLQIGTHPAECAANDPSKAVREANRDVFLRALDLCAALRCAHLTGLPGVWHEGVNRQQDRNLAVAEAVWRMEAAKRLGIRYAVEAHVGSLCAEVASTQSFLAAVPEMTLTLDYGHFVMVGETSQVIHSLLPSASHMHARGGAKGKLQASLPENEIDFATIVQTLQSNDYPGFIALEYVWVDWEGCNRVDNISETILLRRQLTSYFGADT
jgi:sugar phosphate isomerase/epimerase